MASCLPDAACVLRPEELAVLRLRRLYQQHGYQKYRMGRFEEYRLYIEHKNFLASENVITFTDMDGRLLALKPDVTLSIVKDAGEQPFPKRLYYIENVYRPGKNGASFREISQAGLELIGPASPHMTTEAVLLARESLATIGAPFLLSLNHIGFADGLLDALSASSRGKAALREAIAAKSSHRVLAIAAEIGLSEAEGAALAEIPKLYGPPGEVLAKAKPIAANNTASEAVEALAALWETLETLHKAEHIVFDFSALSDPAYYNGVTMAGHIEGLPYAILSGGQYDRLLKRFRKESGGIGFALYLDELARLKNFQSPFFVDAALLYDPAETSPAALAAETAKLTAEGKSVWSGTTLPEDLAYNTLISLKGGGKC